eukprot:m.322941 g.322941  ORF g.322941 m.322941 type:complete len:386 (+) comp27981_c0_seq1:79-1236(+)
MERLSGAARTAAAAAASQMRATVARTKQASDRFLQSTKNIASKQGPERMEVLRQDLSTFLDAVTGSSQVKQLQELQRAAYDDLMAGISKLKAKRAEEDAAKQASDALLAQLREQEKKLNPFDTAEAFEQHVATLTQRRTAELHRLRTLAQETHDLQRSNTELMRRYGDAVRDARAAESVWADSRSRLAIYAGLASFATALLNFFWRRATLNQLSATMEKLVPPEKAVQLQQGADGVAAEAPGAGSDSAAGTASGADTGSSALPMDAATLAGQIAELQAAAKACTAAAAQAVEQSQQALREAGWEATQRAEEQQIASISKRLDALTFATEALQNSLSRAQDAAFSSASTSTASTSSGRSSWRPFETEDVLTLVLFGVLAVATLMRT